VSQIVGISKVYNSIGFARELQFAYNGLDYCLNILIISLVFETHIIINCWSVHLWHHLGLGSHCVGLTSLTKQSQMTGNWMKKMKIVTKLQELIFFANLSRSSDCLRQLYCWSWSKMRWVYHEPSNCNQENQIREEDLKLIWKDCM
jgi:hypothetical protein